MGVGVLGAARSEGKQLLYITTRRSIVVLSLACVVCGRMCSWTAVVCSKGCQAECVQWL